MKSTLLYFNYLEKRIIKTQAAPTQSYNGPKSTANNWAQADTSSLILSLILLVGNY